MFVVGKSFHMDIPVFRINTLSSVLFDVSLIYSWGDMVDGMSEKFQSKIKAFSECNDERLFHPNRCSSQ